MSPVITGLMHFLEDPSRWIGKERLGLLCNPASTDHRFEHARFSIEDRLPGQLKALFSPQHGFFAEKQDNMIESEDMRDPVMGLPVFSLYGTTRKPTQAMFDPIDTLLVDLQDAGTRVYTFIYTLSYCMEAAARWGKKIIIFDRPNPINGIDVEGNCVTDDCRSFVGRYPIPMRHGLTIGELALLFNHHFGIGCDLTIVPLKGWHRAMYYSDCGLSWIAPSPNLPTPVSALVYPGQVIWEGTNVSEGRGTTQPFELFGAPYFQPEKLLERLGEELRGCKLRAVAFEPVAGKWQGQRCQGFQIHVRDQDAYRPYRASLGLLRAVLELFRAEFEWKPPPYEYAYNRQPIDLIIGSRTIRKRLERLDSLADIEADWQAELNEYRRLREDVFLYHG
jgi:uncharacterized protein YbbC (DUF1343 family)